MIKNAKGITLATLIITVMILSIIISVTYSVGMNNLETKNLSNLYTDLKALKDSIGVYYDKYGKLPLKEQYTGTDDFLIDANPNDARGEYYVIDVSKLENLILTRKLTWTGNDVYIINARTHMIYYPEGVYVNTEVYYRLPGEYSKIILPENITIMVSPETWTTGGVTVKVIWADDSEEGGREVSIDGGQNWNPYTGPFTVESNCTVQARRTDENNTIVAIASAIISNIDKEPPIVTAKESSVTIEEGVSNDIANYFTYDQNGIAGIKSVTYTVNGNTIENTNELPVGTYTITCTVTKITNESKSASMTLVVESAGPKLIIKATSVQSETTEYVDEKGNKIVVPGGFKVLTELATTVDKGIVIEDSTGNNQFVWVPIGTITKSDGTEVTIEFGRYSDFSLEATPVQYAKNGGWNKKVEIDIGGFMDVETPTTEGTNRESLFNEQVNCNATSLNLEKFVTTSITNGGYYIARYEASFWSGAQISSVSNGDTSSAGKKAITNQVPSFKQSTTASASSDMGTVTSTPGMLWNYIRQGDASLACQNLYRGNEYNEKDFVQCDLVNSYAWDTAIMFIQKCSDRTTYWNDYTENDMLYNTGEDSEKITDMVCNIYDMAGNLQEWSTEDSYDSYGMFGYQYVMRGGDIRSDEDYYVASRYHFGVSILDDVGFRGVLYCNPPVI